MIKISVCMMVKNEEANLERCLKSVEKLADEIIIVDTGSTDKTLEIARKFNANIYEHEWQNDFSLHRNQSIDYATGDWILIIDADEELFFEGDFKLVKQELEKLPDEIGGVSIDLKDIQKGKCDMLMNSFRFFKKGRIKYTGIVHNKAVIKGEGCFLEGVYLQHYGYDLTEEQREKKKKRTLTLLLERIKKDSDDFEAMFYLVQLFSVLKDNSKSVFWAERYLEICTKLKKQMKDSIYFTVFRCYFSMQDKQNAEKWLLLGLQNTKDILDLCLAMVEFGVWIHNFDLVNNGSIRFEQLYKQLQEKPELKNNNFIFSFKPESLIYCQYCRTLFSFENAVNSLVAFENSSNETKVNKIYKDDLVNNLNINLFNLGIAPVEQILKARKQK